MQNWEAVMAGSRKSADLPAPDDAKPGALRLVPPDAVLKDLRQDYETGTSHMIFGDAPKFDGITDSLRKLEATINGK
jgi:hypothetical protein